MTLEAISACVTYDTIQFDFLATRRLIVDERPMFGSNKKEVVSIDIEFS